MSHTNSRYRSEEIAPLIKYKISIVWKMGAIVWKRGQNGPNRFKQGKTKRNGLKQNQTGETVPHKGKLGPIGCLWHQLGSVLAFI